MRVAWQAEAVRLRVGVLLPGHLPLAGPHP